MKEGALEVDGKELFAPYYGDVPTIPETLPVNVTINQQPDGMLLSTSYGLEVWFDGNWHATVKVPRAIFQGKLCGICADCDGNVINDLLTSSGLDVSDIEKSEAHAKIGNSFVVLGESDEGGVCPIADPVDPFPCKGDMAERVFTEDFCGFDALLSGNPFLPCVSSGRIADGTTLLKETCIYDVCENHLNISISEYWYDCLEEDFCSIDYEKSKDVACSILSVVSDTCRSAGQTTTGWREFFNCPYDCPDNSDYDYEASACPNSCDYPNDEELCSTVRAGCACRPGYVWSGPECVKLEECGCEIEERYYPKGYTIRNDDCTTAALCVGADQTDMNINQTCPSGSECYKNRCVCKPGHVERDDVCVPCQPGTYEKKGDCVACVRGTWSYDGAAECTACERHYTTVQDAAQDPSLCEPVNSSYCEISGDPHYITFDKLKLSPQGECRYIAVENTDNTTGPLFRVIAKHYDMRDMLDRDEAPRVTFLDYLELQIGDFRLALPGREDEIRLPKVNGTPMPAPLTLNVGVETVQFVRGRKGAVILTSFGVEIAMMYNKRMNAGTIKLSSQYMNKTSGICGNFDGVRQNDWWTADRQPTWNLEKKERYSMIGNSYISPDSNSDDFICPDMPELKEDIGCIDEISPLLNDRKYCGFDIHYIGSPFTDCINSGRVNVSQIRDSCDFDVCETQFNSTAPFEPGCLENENCSIDFGAVSEISCAHKEVMASECQRLGYNVNGWRTYFACPLACPAGAHYVSSAPALPRTCASVLGLRSSLFFLDDGVESDGCVCNSSAVYSGGECVHEDSCGCLAELPGESQVYLTVGDEVLYPDCSKMVTCPSGGNTSLSNYTCPDNSECAFARCVCLPGYVWSNNTEECVPCPAGSFGAPGQDKCTVCPRDTYSRSPGSAQCESCPLYYGTNNRTGASNSSMCEDMYVRSCWVIGGGWRTVTFSGETYSLYSTNTTLIYSQVVDVNGSAFEVEATPGFERVHVKFMGREFRFNTTDFSTTEIEQHDGGEVRRYPHMQFAIGDNLEFYSHPVFSELEVGLRNSEGPIVSLIITAGIVRVLQTPGHPNGTGLCFMTNSSMTIENVMPLPAPGPESISNVSANAEICRFGSHLASNPLRLCQLHQRDLFDTLTAACYQDAAFQLMDGGDLKSVSCLHATIASAYCIANGFDVEGWVLFSQCFSEVKCSSGSNLSMDPRFCRWVSDGSNTTIDCERPSRLVNIEQPCECPNNTAIGAYGSCVEKNIGCYPPSDASVKGILSLPEDGVITTTFCETKAFCDDSGMFAVNTTMSCDEESTECVLIDLYRTCQCLAGFENLTGNKCWDINECDQMPCHADANCTNLLGSYNCTCLPGFYGNGTHCENINECSNETLNDCHMNATCTDLPGTYNCSCDEGFLGNGTLCYPGCDVENPCSEYANCSEDTPWMLTCNCTDGFEGNGIYCGDINECELSPCHFNATCNNTFGSFICKCPDGWFGDGFNCSATNECLDIGICHKYADCTDLSSGYNCSCRDGFEGNDTWCEDIDECSRGLDNCGNRTNCTNMIGSYQCYCEPGFEGNVTEACSDINECRDLPDACDPNASCSNFIGSFNCSCNDGFYPSPNYSAECLDINECLEDPCGTVDMGICNNLPGTYNCSCADGFTYNGTTCLNIDECAMNACGTNSNCTDTFGSYICECFVGFNSSDNVNCTDIVECDMDPCPNGAFCNNTIGSYNCTCYDEYRYNNKTQLCDDINECEEDLNDCHDNATCMNFDGGFNCTCDAGYMGNGTQCDDILECNMNGTCAENAVCIELSGSYECDCETGYEGVDAKLNCTNINECEQTPSPCDTNAMCDDTVGSYNCSCNKGYTGDGFNCTDLNECLSADVCSENAECNNLNGTFECICNDGYTFNTTDNFTCVDIDDCALNPCGAGQCNNYVGTYNCTCDAGYMFNGTSCVNINECTSIPDICGNNSQCEDTIGLYVCKCNDGYNSTDGTNCSNINECEDGTDNCDESTYCSDLDGSFECLCVTGFRLDNSSNVVRCNDINECLDNLDDCDANAACTNVNGGFGCSCVAGFTGNGTVCVVYEECSHGVPHPCVNESNCMQQGPAQDFVCECPTGYAGDGRVDGEGCPDLNECTTGPNDCHANATCNNTIGSYTCQCDTGYIGNGTQCDDILECNMNGTCAENAVCIELSGSYECDCEPGYEGADAKLNCTNVNECEQTPSPCDTNAMCTDNTGSFMCECNTGYQGTGLVGNCSDIDECRVNTTCDENADCANTDGSYTCACKNGFILSNGTCNDINECSALEQVCAPNNSICTNTPGSHSCSCEAGYSGNPVSECLDIDECLTDPCDTNADCANTGGSFTCACRSGFTGNGTYCEDIPECDNATLCETNETCVELPGSYRCDCISGFSKDGGSSVCVNVNECLSDACTNSNCSDLIGDFMCNCWTGYMVFNKTLCEDIDECDNPNTTCTANSTCLNTPGSYSCPCDIGYEANGAQCVNINECTNKPCVNAACIDTEGSFTCTCKSGFNITDNSSVCNDINECLTSPCHADADCTNNDGSFTCACKTGFNGDGLNCRDATLGVRVVVIIIVIDFDSQNIDFGELLKLLSSTVPGGILGRKRRATETNVVVTQQMIEDMLAKLHAGIDTTIQFEDLALEYNETTGQLALSYTPKYSSAAAVIPQGEYGNDLKTAIASYDAVLPFEGPALLTASTVQVADENNNVTTSECTVENCLFVCKTAPTGSDITYCAAPDQEFLFKTSLPIIMKTNHTWINAYADSSNSMTIALTNRLQTAIEDLYSQLPGFITLSTIFIQPRDGTHVDVVYSLNMTAADYNMTTAALYLNDRLAERNGIVSSDAPAISVIGLPGSVSSTGVIAVTLQCTTSHCENGGTCDDTTGVLLCQCTDGFIGTTCAEASPCSLDGTYTTASQSCACKTGFVGNGYVCQPEPAGFDSQISLVSTITITAVWEDALNEPSSDARKILENLLNTQIFSRLVGGTSRRRRAAENTKLVTVTDIQQGVAAGTIDVTYTLFGVDEPQSCQTQYDLAQNLLANNGEIAPGYTLSGHLTYGSNVQLTCSSSCVSCTLEQECKMSEESYTLPSCITVPSPPFSQNAALIVTICITVVVFLAVIVAIIVFCYRRRSSGKDKTGKYTWNPAWGNAVPTPLYGSTSMYGVKNPIWNKYGSWDRFRQRDDRTPERERERASSRQFPGYTP